MLRAATNPREDAKRVGGVRERELPPQLARGDGVKFDPRFFDRIAIRVFVRAYPRDAARETTGAKGLCHGEARVDVSTRASPGKGDDRAPNGP